MAIFRPPLEDRSQLLEPLNPGEQRVAEALAGLDDGWTVYLQPRIAQDVPDAVAVHDRHGVCAIEVKDWNRSGYRQAPDGSIEYRTADGWRRSAEHPRYQAYRYRATIFDQFFAHPRDGNVPNEGVRAVVILPRYSTADAGRLLERHGVTEAEYGIMVWGGDALNGTIERVVRGVGCPPPRSASIGRLRRHLAESQIVADLCEPVNLSPAARNI